MTVTYANEAGKWPCACCGYYAMALPAGSTHDLCPICGWEDDNVQFEDPDFPRGPNNPSLREARLSFDRCGTSDPERSCATRKPLEAEEPRFDWHTHKGRGGGG
jgi:hypothetical protein